MPIPTSHIIGAPIRIFCCGGHHFNWTCNNDHEWRLYGFHNRRLFNSVEYLSINSVVWSGVIYRQRKFSYMSLRHNFSKPLQVRELFLYQWFSSNGFYSQLQNPTAIADSAAQGIYRLCSFVKRLHEFTTANGNCCCTPEPYVTIGPDITVCINGPLYFVTASGNYPLYTWMAGSFGQQHVAGATGLYWVMVTDSLGCRGYDSAHRVIRCGPQAQNIFTPNGDESMIIQLRRRTISFHAMQNLQQVWHFDLRVE